MLPRILVRSPLLALLLAGCSDPAKQGDTGDTGDTTATGCPALNYDADALDWAGLPRGVGSEQTVTILNQCTDGDPLTIDASVAGDGFSLGTGLLSIAPGQIGTLLVTATLDTWDATGTLTLVTNDPAHPQAILALTASLDPDQDGDGVAHDADCDDDDATAYPGAEEVWYDGVDQDCDGRDDDQDGDGHGVADDCDDFDPAVHPGATESWYDGVDQDCDGDDDDQDGDGHGVADDCDDLDPASFPGAPEVWYDGIDEDCAGGDDDDQDGDGQAAAGAGGTDCDDTDPSVYLGAVETWYDGVDGDCAGDSDNDADHDGFDAPADDCDDTDAAVNPAATEVWYDGIDQDCDGASDYDQDGDGVAAYAWGGSDCADTDATTLTGVAETRNGIDDDCDGAVDEGLAQPGDLLVSEVMTNPAAVSDSAGEWFEVYNPTTYDVDLAGWTVYADDGNRLTVGASVVVPAGGYVVLGTEADPALNGGVTVDYAYSRVDFALSDADSVHLAIDGTTISELSFGSGWPVGEGASLSLDPTATASATSASAWCAATSSYGLGDLGTPGAANDLCPQIDHDGDAYAADDGDCDDADATVHPGAVETEDGRDTDCDGLVDAVTFDADALPGLTGGSVGADLDVCGTGDVDGDGVIDVFLGGSSYHSYLYVVDGGGFAGWSGAVAASAGATLTHDWYDYLGCGGPAADVTGDGVGDLAVTVHSASMSSGYGWYLYEGPLTGSLSVSSASFYTSGSLGPDGALRTDLDFDGDGVTEVLDADPAYGSYGGIVRVYETAGLAGAVDADADATLRYTSRTVSALLGVSADGADVDGDGYLDLVLGTYTTAIYVIPGDGLATAESGDVTSFASLTLTATRSNYLTPVVGDFDGDGGIDVAAATGEVFADVGSHAGTLTPADATTYIRADSCDTLYPALVAQVDGAPGLVMQCQRLESDGDRTYAALLFGDALSATSDADADRGVLFTAPDPGTDAFEYFVRHVVDLDGDGDVEWLFGNNDRTLTYTGEGHAVVVDDE